MRLHTGESQAAVATESSLSELSVDQTPGGTDVSVTTIISVSVRRDQCSDSSHTGDSFRDTRVYKQTVR